MGVLISLGSTAVGPFVLFGLCRLQKVQVLVLPVVFSQQQLLLKASADLNPVVVSYSVLAFAQAPPLHHSAIAEASNATARPAARPRPPPPSLLLLLLVTRACVFQTKNRLCCGDVHLAEPLCAFLPGGCCRHYCCCAAIPCRVIAAFAPTAAAAVCCCCRCCSHSLLRVLLKCAVFVVVMSYAVRGFLHRISCFPYRVLLIEVSLHDLHRHVFVENVQDAYFSAVFVVVVFLLWTSVSY